MNFIATFRFLWSYMRDMKGRYLAFYLGWLFHTIVGVATPLVFGDMVNQVIYEHDLNAFLKKGLIFFGVTVLGIGLYYWIYEMYGVLWNGINRRLRFAMFDRLQSMGADKISTLQYGDTINMIQFWSMEGVHFMIRNVVHNVNNILRIVVCIILMFMIYPVFGGITLIMVPLSVFTTMKIGKRIRKNGDRNRDLYSPYIAWFYEVADSLGELRLWSAERNIVKKYEQKNRELKKTVASIELENTVGNELLANIKNLILVTQYGILAYCAIHGDLTIGSITVLLSYFTFMTTALTELSSTFMDAQRRIGVIEKIKEFCEKSIKEQDGKAKADKNLEKPVKQIILDNCSFQYDDEKEFCLKELNMSLQSGEKVAIVGENGAGKSTLFHLLTGFYTPTSGRILLNGENLSEIAPASFYDQISVVFQQPMLGTGNIRENLQMGKRVTEEEMIKACKAAGIYDFITDQKDGFDTILEKQGMNLSGGQRQRLAIARAYLKDASLVLMDEATSALDSESEQWVLDHWEEPLQGKLCLMISHRLPVIMRCDRVILLKNGKICEVDTPENMCKNCKDFQELFALA